MVITLRQNFTENPRNLLRQCGNNEIYDRKTGKDSFVRKLRGDFYPRYHVYVSKDEPGFLQLNIHLDMKKPSYEGFTAHSGEYEGPLIDQEVERIKQVVSGFIVVPGQGGQASSGSQTGQKKSFWSKIFGGGDLD